MQNRKVCDHELVCLALQIPKYLKIGNFMKIFKCQSQNLQQIIHRDHDHSSKQ